MSALVPGEQIEQIVGVERHQTRHFARAVSAEETVYILHSRNCLESDRDLRDCFYSQALDNGIDEAIWATALDQPVRVAVTRQQRLIPVQAGMKVAD
jgi:hypothetical protein